MGFQVKTLSGRYICTVLLSSILLCGTSVSIAHAQSCDMRVLKLTPEQKNKLRDIRMTLKAHSEERSEQLNNVLKDNAKRRIEILNKSTFDENLARRSIMEYHILYMENELEELKAQHEFLYVLNTQQQQYWLENCQK